MIKQIDSIDIKAEKEAIALSKMAEYCPKTGKIQKNKATPKRLFTTGKCFVVESLSEELYTRFLRNGVLI